MNFEILLYIMAVTISVSLVLVTFIEHRNLAFIDRCIILDWLRELSNSGKVSILSKGRSRIIFTSNNVIYELIVKFQYTKVRESRTRNNWTKFHSYSFEELRSWIDSFRELVYD